jgi:protein-disulfide isomerase
VAKLTEKRVSLIGAGLILAAAVVYATCGAVEGVERISYRDLVGRLDASELTPTETKALDVLLNQEVSPCGDDVSLGASLFNPDRCPLAPLAAEFVVSMLKEDFNVEEISIAYVSRYAAVKGLDVPLDGSPRLGPDKPLITIVVFSDFECPVCAKAAQALSRLVLEYPEHIALIYKYYPLTTIHPTAELAARAGFAAARQDKFWAMHDTLFSAQGSPLDRERILIMALGLGLDVDAFEKDMASPEATKTIEADHRLGKELGVDGTPSLFVNGRIVRGGLAELEARIHEEFLRAAVAEKQTSKIK